MLGGAGRLIRGTTIKSFEIFEKGLLEAPGKIPKRGFGFTNAFDDFVVDVRDVHDMTDAESFEIEVAPHEVGENERAPVSDVGEIINRRSAAVHADVSAGRVERHEVLQ